jgi:hypothetical protein
MGNSNGHKKVVVSVRGGVVEVEDCPKDVQIVIIDHDNLHENIVEALGLIEDLKFSSINDRADVADSLYDSIVDRIKEYGSSIPLWEIVKRVYYNDSRARF